MKPMLASDWDESKQKFPVIGMPKIDGVRGLTIANRFVGRSLKTPDNRYVTETFSDMRYTGLDGEVTDGSPRAPDVCAKTSSLLKTIQGIPVDLRWYTFDRVTEDTADLPYKTRLELLTKHVTALRDPRVKVVSHVVIRTPEELATYRAKNLLDGYEGTILRDPEAPHKQGRSTPTEGGYLRIKDFIEEEGVVTRILEGQANGNEATVNELGQTTRSTHKANMTPNGLVGAVMVQMLKTGKVIKASAGIMTAKQRKDWFDTPATLLGHVVKVKSFPIGVKDLPRFPTYNGHRYASDLDLTPPWE